jgi:hypothetical protein
MALWRLNAEGKVGRIFVMERSNKPSIKYENSWKETRQET